MKERKFVRREIAPGATATVAEDASPETIKAIEESVRCVRHIEAAFAGATGSVSGHAVKIKKHRGADVPSYYVVCFDGEGKVVGVLVCHGDGWWTKREAEAAGARWLLEKAKPTLNT